MFALTELYQTIIDAWRAADVRRRLAAWLWVIAHRGELERPGGWLQ